MLRRIIYFILLFLLFFGFTINGLNTRYIASALLLIIVLIAPNINHQLRLLLSPRNVNILFSILLYNVIVFLYTIFEMTWDLSMLKGSIRILIIYIDILFLQAILPENDRKYTADYLILIFVIQSVIIIAAFASPYILGIVQQFQYEDIREQVENSYLTYGTFRGLALSGDQFYGLTSSFGLMFIVTTNNLITERRIIYLFAFILLCIANLFVGRTGFAGILISLLLVLVNIGMNNIITVIRNLLIGITLVIITYKILPVRIKETFENQIFPYAFQLFYNYKELGVFETSSTNRVLEMWHEGFSLKTFLIGDACFINNDGTYYRHVDVGYLRQLFYGGIFFVIYSISLVYNILIGSHIWKISKIITRKYKFELAIFIYIAIVHTKGLAFMYCPEIMMIVLLLSINTLKNYSRV